MLGWPVWLGLFCCPWHRLVHLLLENHFSVDSLHWYGCILLLCNTGLSLAPGLCPVHFVGDAPCSGARGLLSNTCCLLHVSEDQDVSAMRVGLVCIMHSPLLSTRLSSLVGFHIKYYLNFYLVSPLLPSLSFSCFQSDPVKIQASSCHSLLETSSGF